MVKRKKMEESCFTFLMKFYDGMICYEEVSERLAWYSLVNLLMIFSYFN